MGTIRKWTPAKIQEEALKYTTRTEFQYQSKGAYGAAKRQGILDKVCSHMEILQKTWTIEAIKAEALKYSSRTEFFTGSKSAYMAAYSQGIFEEVCSHIPSKRVPIANEEIILAASKCTTINEFMVTNKRLYDAAVRRGIKEEICAHMSGTKTIWTKEAIFREAAKYDRKIELKMANSSAYRAMCRLNLMEEACAHMGHRTINRQRFAIPQGTIGLYMLYNDDKVVYIGKSISCIKNRVASHTVDKEFTSVEVFNIPSKADLDVIELYLINLHTPVYNTDCNSKDLLSIKIQDLEAVLKNKTVYTERKSDAE